MIDQQNILLPASLSLAPRSVRNWLKAHARLLIQPEARAAIKTLVSGVHETISRACLWRWQLAPIPRGGNEPYQFVYLGRRAQREQAVAQFLRNTSKQDISGNSPLAKRACTVLIGDLATPGSLRVPIEIHTAIPLNRTIEEISSAYDHSMRRVIRQEKSRSEVRHVIDTAAINNAERDMLRPYAAARYGQDAAQINESMVQQIAVKHGRLDVVYQEGKAVSCHLGYGSTHQGRKYWHGMRFGYSEAVFSDPKRLFRINSVNSYLAIEWAIENNYDYYGFGFSLGQPDDGLLQWKRRRGAHLDSSLKRDHFYVRLPKTGAAQLLWNSPLFDDKNGFYDLHIGLPAQVTDAEAIDRYLLIGFGGIKTAYIHHARPISEALLAALQGLFSSYKSATAIKTLSVSS